MGGIHLVKWEEITKPRKDGGLGLRSMEHMNSAFLSKLGWRLITEDKGLWRDALAAKYMRSKLNIEAIKTKKGVSHIWIGISKVAPIIKEGLRMDVKNGRSTLFWRDAWLEASPLQYSLLRQIDEKELQAKVVDFWDDTSGWKEEELRDLLPTVTLNKLHSRILSSDMEDRDRLMWGNDDSGTFTVSSAYRLAKPEELSTTRDDWSLIWRLKIPSCIITFLWLIKHGKVLTNVERCRRNISVNNHCPFCAEKREDLDHTFRTCPRANHVWEKVYPYAAISDSHLLTFDDWFERNTRRKPDDSARFAVTLW